MFERLKSFYSDLHWKRTGFFAKLLLLVMAILRFVPEALLLGIVSALVSFASTTYSIAGTMDAKFKEVGESGGIPAFSVWFWGPLMIVCGILALISTLLATIFKSFLTANQCDVVSRILQQGRLHSLALHVACQGMKRKPREHTRAFLRIRIIRLKRIDPALALPELNSILWEVEHFTDVRQAARVFTQLADAFAVYDNRHPEITARERARAINRQLRLADQLLKTPIA